MRESEPGKSYFDIPGPKPLPILGNALLMHKNLRRLRLFYEECFNEYGEVFRFIIPGMKVKV